MDMCLTHKTRSAMSPEYQLNIINVLHKLITLNSWTRGKTQIRTKVLAVKGTFGSRPVDRWDHSITSAAIPHWHWIAIYIYLVYSYLILTPDSQSALTQGDYHPNSTGTLDSHQPIRRLYTPHPTLHPIANQPLMATIIPTEEHSRALRNTR